MSVYSLSSADAHQAIATTHRVLANPELTPLILALVEQCLQSKVRPEHGIMLLLRGRHIDAEQILLPLKQGGLCEQSNRRI